MPELPEVESIRLTLANHILGKRIVAAKIFWAPVAASSLEGNFSDLIQDQVIGSLGRRGKYLLIHLSGGLTLIAHFRMTGRLVYHDQPQEPEKHTHIIIYLDEGELHYTDTRKFGRIQLVATQDIAGVPSLAKLGPEPLADEFVSGMLARRLAGKKCNIKAALLDQTVVAGIGNIYADEAVFRAGILPEREAGSIAEPELASLCHSIREVLNEGIQSRGTSFRDYRDADGNEGAFQRNLNVYGRGGLECKICGRKLSRKRIAGRTTVYCENCQK